MFSSQAQRYDEIAQFLSEHSLPHCTKGNNILNSNANNEGDQSQMNTLNNGLFISSVTSRMA
jgi:hypothetical protein